MSFYYTIPVVVEAELAEARRTLGAGMARILGYYEEDGAKSIGQVERALAEGNAAAMVIPAHTLKGESRQFGAKRLGDLAEAIEKTARRCVEEHTSPSEVAAEVAMLRGCFSETLAILRTAAAPHSPATSQAHPAAVSRPSPFGSGPRTFGRRTG